MHRGTGPYISVVYFFFKHSVSEKNIPSALMLSLISQLVCQDEVLLDVLYKKCLSIDQKVRSISLIRELASIAFGSQRFCFVVVDGLDECIGESAVRNEGSQCEVINLFQSVMNNDDLQDSGPTDRCVRLLICSQRNGFLEDRLTGCLRLQLELNSDHIRDIETYSEAQSLLIQKRFPTYVDEKERMAIVDRVCSGAKGMRGDHFPPPEQPLKLTYLTGMFLYAKIVLGNLLGQPSLGHLKRELKNENFPKGLDEAYADPLPHSAFFQPGTVTFCSPAN